MSKERNYTLEEKAVILNVKAEQDTCYFCGKKLEADSRVRTIDHLIPLNRGGDTIQSNLVVACHECNCEKSDMTEAEYFRYLEIKNNMQLEFKEKIALEEEKFKKILSIDIQLNEQDNIIKKLENICKEYKDKRKVVRNIKDLISLKINSLKKEKDLTIQAFEISAKNKIGKLNKDYNQIKLDSLLDHNFNLEDIQVLNADDIDEMMKSIATEVELNVIADSKIIDSVITNSNINNSVVENSVVTNSIIENSILRNIKEKSN